MILKAIVRREFERHYRDGKTAGWTAALLGCSPKTARKWFRFFEAQGIERAMVRRRSMRTPVYTGPDLIGVSADVR
jgi:hypothetical protein